MDAINAKSQEYYEKNSINSTDLLCARPTSASVAQSIEWIQFITNAHRKELLEKRNILERVNYESSETLSFLYEQWARPIHLDPAISTSNTFENT